MRVINLDKVMKRLDKHKEKIESNITTVKKELVRAVLADLVNLSPQWSGNLASNWVVETSNVKGSYSPHHRYGRIWDESKAYKRGDKVITEPTIDSQQATIDSIRWNSKVSIANYTPYASYLEQEQKSTKGQPIRPENLYHGKVAMAAFVSTKYSKIGAVRLIKYLNL